jgi:hypothetical protein
MPLLAGEQPQISEPHSVSNRSRSSRAAWAQVARAPRQSAAFSNRPTITGTHGASP